MQKKNLLSKFKDSWITKIIAPVSLALFASGCYTVANVGETDNSPSPETRIEIEGGFGSYLCEPLYGECGYVPFFESQIYFNPKFHHFGIHHEPFWHNKQGTMPQNYNNNEIKNQVKERSKETENLRNNFESRNQLQIRNNSHGRNNQKDNPKNQNNSSERKENRKR